jgi:uncharacterized membrane protein YecN with MAPEG domain
MTLPITSLLAGVFALLMVPLTLQISMRRARLGGISAGDGTDEVLPRRIRAHGNFIEYAPTALIEAAYSDMRTSLAAGHASS